MDDSGQDTSQGGDSLLFQDALSSPPANSPSRMPITKSRSKDSLSDQTPHSGDKRGDGEHSTDSRPSYQSPQADTNTSLYLDAEESPIYCYMEKNFSSDFRGKLTALNGITGDTGFVSSSANSSNVELSLMHDTRLLVLHYLSSDQGDSSNTTTTTSEINHSQGNTSNDAGVALGNSTSSTSVSNGQHRCVECILSPVTNDGSVPMLEGSCVYHYPLDTGSLTDSEQNKRRRLLRPRFHSSPAISHMSGEDTMSPDCCDGCVVEANGVGSEREHTPKQPGQQKPRPNLKLNIRAAKNYSDRKFSHDYNEFEFSSTREERFHRQIAEELTRSMEQTGSALVEGSGGQTPFSKVASFLKLIAARDVEPLINEIMRRELRAHHRPAAAQEIVDYPEFSTVVEHTARAMPTQGGWTEIALYMRICRQFVDQMLQKGHEKVTYIADYTARFIFERAAQFLIENGGWGAVANMSPSNPLFVSSSSSNAGISPSQGQNKPSADNKSAGLSKHKASRNTKTAESNSSSAELVLKPANFYWSSASSSNQDNSTQSNSPNYPPNSTQSNSPNYPPNSTQSNSPTYPPPLQEIVYPTHSQPHSPNYPPPLQEIVSPTHSQPHSPNYPPPLQEIVSPTHSQPHSPNYPPPLQEIVYPTISLTHSPNYPPQVAIVSPTGSLTHSPIVPPPSVSSGYSPRVEDNNNSGAKADGVTDDVRQESGDCADGSSGRNRSRRRGGPRLPDGSVSYTIDKRNYKVTEYDYGTMKLRAATNRLSRGANSPQSREKHTDRIHHIPTVHERIFGDQQRVDQVQQSERQIGSKEDNSQSEDTDSVTTEHFPVTLLPSTRLVKGDEQRSPMIESDTTESSPLEASASLSSLSSDQHVSGSASTTEAAPANQQQTPAALATETATGDMDVRDKASDNTIMDTTPGEGESEGRSELSALEEGQKDDASVVHEAADNPGTDLDVGETNRQQKEPESDILEGQIEPLVSDSDPTDTAAVTDSAAGNLADSDSDTAADEEEGDMSIFGNRSSKKKKSSSQAHGLDGAGRYNNPYVDYSPIQHVHRKSPPKDLSILSNGESSENLPQLTPSPYGSLRDIQQAVSGPDTGLPTSPGSVYSSGLGADSRSISSFTSSSQYSQYSDYSQISATSPPPHQRLAHYNRHKALTSPRRRKKDKLKGLSDSCHSLDYIKVLKNTDNNNDTSVSPVKTAQLGSLESSPVYEEIEQLDLDSEEADVESHTDTQCSELPRSVKRSHSYEAAIPHSDIAAQSDSGEPDSKVQEGDTDSSVDTEKIIEPQCRVKRSDSYEAAIPIFDTLDEDRVKTLSSVSIPAHTPTDDTTSAAVEDITLASSVNQVETIPSSHIGEKTTELTSEDRVDQTIVDSQSTQPVIEENLTSDCAVTTNTESSREYPSNSNPNFTDPEDFANQLLSLEAERSELLGTVEVQTELTDLQGEPDIQNTECEVVADHIESVSAVQSESQPDSAFTEPDCGLPLNSELVETELADLVESQIGEASVDKADCVIERRPSITPELSQTAVLGLTGEQSCAGTNTAVADFERRPSLTAETSHTEVLGITAEQCDKTAVSEVAVSPHRRESLIAEVLVADSLGLSDNRSETEELSTQRPTWERKETNSAELIEQPLVLEDQILPSITQSQQASPSDYQPLADTNSLDISLDPHHTEVTEDIISENQTQSQFTSGINNKETLAPEELIASQIVEQVVQDAIEQCKAEQDQEEALDKLHEHTGEEPADALLVSDTKEKQISAPFTGSDYTGTTDTSEVKLDSADSHNTAEGIQDTSQSDSRNAAEVEPDSTDSVDHSAAQIKKSVLLGRGSISLDSAKSFELVAPPPNTPMETSPPQKLDVPVSSEATENHTPPAQIETVVTPSSSPNLSQLEKSRVSAEYRLETDTHELEDREHLTPHTPVADQVNTSYPNSEEEEEESTPNIPDEDDLVVVPAPSYKEGSSTSNAKLETEQLPAETREPTVTSTGETQLSALQKVQSPAQEQNNMTAQQPETVTAQGSESETTQEPKNEGSQESNMETSNVSETQITQADEPSQMSTFAEEPVNQTTPGEGGDAPASSIHEEKPTGAPTKKTSVGQTLRNNWHIIAGVGILVAASAIGMALMIKNRH